MNIVRRSGVSVAPVTSQFTGPVRKRRISPLPRSHASILFVEALRDRNIPAVWGNATEPEVLIQARIRDDRAFVIATPQTLQVRSMVETSRTLNPTIEIVVRNHNADEAERLEKEGVGTVFVGESELANATVRQVLELVKAPAGAPR